MEETSSSENFELIRRIFEDKMRETTNALLISMENMTNTLIESINEMTKRTIAEMESMNKSLDSMKCAVEKIIDNGCVNQKEAQKHMADTIVPTLLSIEEEREERKCRKQNVIVCGLDPDPTIKDEALVSEIFEKHLSIKPQIINTQRLGQKSTGAPAKLRVTLRDTNDVEELLHRSMQLRLSDSSERRIFINRDLTRRQQEADYRKRCGRRERRLQPVVQPTCSGTLNKDGQNA